MEERREIQTIKHKFSMIETWIQEFKDEKMISHPLTFTFWAASMGKRIKFLKLSKRRKGEEYLPCLSFQVISLNFSRFSMNF